MKNWPVYPYFKSEDEPAMVTSGMNRLITEWDLDFYCFREVKWPHSTGFDHNFVVCTNLPDVWTNRYQERCYYLQEPVRQYALKTSRPFYWEKGRFMRNLDSLSRRLLTRVSLMA